jgi:peptide/nickel transport system substrate-binding protein/oligopeptide transport system substrate-binding protein
MKRNLPVCRWPLTGRSFLTLFCLVCLFSSGCRTAPSPGGSSSGQSAGPGTPGYGGVFHRAFSSSLLSIDPRDVTDSYTHEVARQIFDGLVEFDANAQVVPAIAEKWEISADRQTYTFTLRSNCRFHAVNGKNGAPTRNQGRLVTAEDVRYTFLRLLEPSGKSPRGKFFWVIDGAEKYAKGETKDISGIVVVASDTISLHLAKPFSPFLSLLALCNAFILPREDVEFLKEEFARSPVGTGPFLWSGQSGDTITLRANPNYFRGRPYLDEIVFSVIRDEMERFQAFKAGKLSEVDVPDPEYKNIRNDPGWSPHFQEVSRWGTQYLGFNPTHPPFDNAKVRQAFNYAIDRETIVKLILNERARVARGVLPPGILGFNPNLKGYDFNPERGRQLLAEAGFPEGKGFPEIALQINTDSMHNRIAEFIVANLRDIGVTCMLKELDFAEHIRTIAAGQAAFFRLGWTVDYPDPDNFLYTMFHSSNFGMEGNLSLYKNPLVDEILEKARYEIALQDRIQLYQSAEQLIVDDAPWVFVYHYTTHVLHQPNVRGLLLTPMGQPFVAYRNIWLAAGSGTTGSH